MIVLEQAVADPSTGSAEKTDSQRLYLVPVLAVALLLRLSLALVMIKRGPNLWFYNQASELGCLAQSVVDGHGLGSPFCGSTGPSAFLAPGYPLLVALAFRLFGGETIGSTAMIIALQTGFGLLTILSAMLVARRIFDTRTAAITGALCAISPAIVQLPVVFWETSFTTLSLMGAMALSLRCIDCQERSNWAWLGVLCGISMLVNPALLLTLAGIVAVTTYRAPRSVRRGPLVTLLAWSLVFSVWPVRNQFVLHAFVPLRSNFGYELWQGNRPGSDGEFSADQHPNTNRVEHSRYAQLGEIAYMREKSMLAFSAIKASPTRFVGLCLKRTARYWTGFTTGNRSVLIILNLSLTSLSAVAGLFLLRKKNCGDALLPGAPLLLFPLPYYITHADCRFRLVLEPLAIMLSVYAFQSLYRLGRERRLLALGAEYHTDSKQKRCGPRP